MTYTINIKVGLKKGVADPEGKNVKKTLELLGLSNLGAVHTARLYTVEVDAPSEEEAREEARVMCEKLLANPVINIYTIDVN